MADTAHRSNGYKVATGTDEIVFNFTLIVPLADTVVSAIVGPANTTYDGDEAGLASKTLKASIHYPISGTSITLSSGSAILFK